MIKYKKIIWSLLFIFGVGATVQAQQTNAEKIVHSINKGIAIYNSLTNPALLSAIGTFTDSTGVRVYPKAHISDTTLAARVFNQLNDLKVPNKQAPYIEVIVLFTPAGQLNNATNFNVQLQLQPSPDLQIAATTLQDIVTQVNGILSGSIQPENYTSINTAIIEALNQLKNNLGNTINTILTIDDFLKQVIVYLTDSIDYNHGIKYQQHEKKCKTVDSIANNYNSWNHQVINEGGGILETAFMISYGNEDNSGNYGKELTQQEIDNIPNSQIKSYMQNMEQLSSLKKDLAYLEFYYQIIIEYWKPQFFNDLKNQIMQSGQQAGIDIMLLLLNGAGQQQLKQFIINYISEQIHQAYIDSNNNY